MRSIPQNVRTTVFTYVPNETKYVEKTKFRIFSLSKEQLVIRALLYSHHEVIEEFSESCRKVFGKLMKHHSKPIYVRIKPVYLEHEILGADSRIQSTPPGKVRFS